MTQLFSDLTSQLLGKSSCQQPSKHVQLSWLQQPAKTSCNTGMRVTGLLWGPHSQVQKEASQEKVLSSAPAALGEMKCISHP